MSINYQNSSLKLVYDGKCYDIFKSNLKIIDDFTMCELSKFSLLKKLLSSPFINTQQQGLLKIIHDGLPSEYMLEDEYDKFNFFVTVKDSSTEVILPVLYEQYNLDKKKTATALSTDRNLLEILKLYSKRVETDSNNKAIIYDIASTHQKIITSGLVNELIRYNDLNEQVKNGVYLEPNDYSYYLSLRTVLQFISSRDESISKFMSNINNSHYKKRSLCIIKKFYEGQLSEFSETIVSSENNEYDKLIGILLDKTKVLKK